MGISRVIENKQHKGRGRPGGENIIYLLEKPAECKLTVRERDLTGKVISLQRSTEQLSQMMPN